jgi:hypothetical protein
MNQTPKHSTEQHTVVKQWQQNKVTGHNTDLHKPSNHVSHNHCYEYVMLMSTSGHKQETCSMLSVTH